MKSFCCLYCQLWTYITSLFSISFGYYEEAIIYWASSFSSIFLHGNWGLTTEIPIFTTLNHSLCDVKNDQKQHSYLFYQRSAFLVLFLQESLLACNFNKKRFRQSCFPMTFSKDTFFIKYLRTTASSTGKISMIAG